MDELTIHELPELRRPTLIAAFSGWPDAAEAASGSIRYLTRKLRARRFAEIDPETFYVFTETRPNTILLAPGQRAIEWPTNEFFAWRDATGDADLILFQGREPNLNWRGYVDALLQLAERCEVQQVVALGGTYDAVSHRGPVRLSGHGSTEALRAQLSRFGIESTSYQGPSSVQSAMLDACQRRGLPAASLWGHAPQYVRAVPNAKVSHAVLAVLSAWLDVDLDLAEIRVAGEQLEARVEAAISDNPEVTAYVEQLGVDDERSTAPDLELLDRPDGPRETPTADDVLRELEELLRQSRADDDL
ncbi:MAG: PAC2 family protein [Chloroflexota bacterium]